MNVSSFRREDESRDPLFYEQSRLVVHIDQLAVESIRQYLGQRLPGSGLILDLMSSWRSHFPVDSGLRHVVGLGLNAEEMNQNPQLTECLLHDLNANPRLPFKEDIFDSAVVTVSIQYVTNPLRIFRDMLRVLKNEASFHVIYSNRMFPTKAVQIWRMLDDQDRGELIKQYFEKSGEWEQIELLGLGDSDFGTDPVFVVTARKPRRRR